MTMSEPINEITFVAWLSTRTALWRQLRDDDDKETLIYAGAIEDRPRDPNTGTVRRCDMRLSSKSGRRLASGEFKRPEVPEGRDPRSEALRADARYSRGSRARDAVLAGLDEAR